MKSCKKLSVFLSLILVICLFAFAGCSSLSINDLKLSKYNEETTQNQTLNIATEGLSLQERKTKIAEEYISISFTIIIAKRVETTVTSLTGEVTSSDVKETFASFGSGTVIHKGGYILTNYHVINPALSEPTTVSQTSRFGDVTKIKTSYVVYASQNGGADSYEATIVWSAYNFDLAIIVCPHFQDLNAAPMKDRSVYCADSDRINVLEEVITVGTQYNQENYGSATTGTISSTVNRSVYGSELKLNYEYLIQHNASINHGNSGGALVDLDGYLIGANTLGIDGANSIFYAVSIYPVMLVLDTVVKNWEEKALPTTDVSVGLSGIDRLMVKNAPSGMIDNKYSQFSDTGVIVIGVEENCLIDGIKVDDIIKEIKFTGATTTETFEINNTYDFLYARLRLHEYNTCTVKVLRGENLVELTLRKG